MEPITIAFGVVVLVSAYLAEKYYEYHNKVAGFELQREEFIKTLAVHEESYIPEPCDQNMIEECKSYLNQKLPNGIKAEFEAIADIEERKRLMFEIAENAAQIMKIGNTKIRFVDFPLWMEGRYNQDEDVVEINESLVLNNPQEVVNTLFHELKHRVQRLSLNNDVWHYSAQRKAEWLYCFENYSNAAICFEAYQGQLVEVDARKFANAITD